MSENDDWSPRPVRGTAYQRIVRAAAKGCGVRLTPWECEHLARDSAIYQAAENDDDRDAGGDGDVWR